MFRCSNGKAFIFQSPCCNSSCVRVNENKFLKLLRKMSKNIDKLDLKVYNDLKKICEEVDISVLLRICEYLECNIGDICDAIKIDDN